MKKNLVLASASPRRRMLLQSIGIRFVCEKPSVVEQRRPSESPPAFARRMAAEKAASVLERTGRETLVLAADTVVFLGDQVLHKPENSEQASKTLSILSGRTHSVVTGMALHADGIIHQKVVVTTVRFRRLSPQEIDWYVSTGEPLDKAGAYGIQGVGIFLIAGIDGSPSNVIGLPLAETIDLLVAARAEIPWKNGQDKKG